MELGIILALVGVAGAVCFWVWRTAKAEADTEAYRGQNKAQGDKITELQDKVLGDYAAQDREDRLRAEEILRKRDGGAAGQLLRDSTRDDFN